MLKYLFLMLLHISYVSAQSLNDSISQTKEPDINKFYLVDVVPKYLNITEITTLIYKENYCCHCEPFEGRIILRILIDEKGNYVRHIVAKSTNWRVLKEVEKYAKELRFTPAYQQNKPVKFWINVPFNFNL